MLRSLFLHRIALLAVALCATPAHSTGLTLNCHCETVVDDRTLRHAPAGEALPRGSSSRLEEKARR